MKKPHKMSKIILWGFCCLEMASSLFSMKLKKNAQFMEENRGGLNTMVIIWGL